MGQCYYERKSKYLEKTCGVFPVPEKSKCMLQESNAGDRRKALATTYNVLIKHKTIIDTPKIVNIFILYVSTINLNHL
jgi:hypothetical protein